MNRIHWFAAAAAFAAAFLAGLALTAALFLAVLRLSKLAGLW